MKCIRLSPENALNTPTPFTPFFAVGIHQNGKFDLSFDVSGGVRRSSITADSIVARLTVCKVFEQYDPL
jgi:hypothetical protein